MSKDGARRERNDLVRLVSWLDGVRGMTAVENDCLGVWLGIAVTTLFLIGDETDLLVGLFLRTSLVPSSWNLYRS